MKCKRKPNAIAREVGKSEAHENATSDKTDRVCTHTHNNVRSRAYDHDNTCAEKTADSRCSSENTNININASANANANATTNTNANANTSTNANAKTNANTKANVIANSPTPGERVKTLTCRWPSEERQGPFIVSGDPSLNIFNFEDGQDNERNQIHIQPISGYEGQDGSGLGVPVLPLVEGKGYRIFCI